MRRKGGTPAELARHELGLGYGVKQGQLGREALWGTTCLPFTLLDSGAQANWCNRPVVAPWSNASKGPSAASQVLADSGYENACV